MNSFTALATYELKFLVCCALVELKNDQMGHHAINQSV